MEAHFYRPLSLIQLMVYIHGIVKSYNPTLAKSYEDCTNSTKKYIFLTCKYHIKVVKNLVLFYSNNSLIV